MLEVSRENSTIIKGIAILMMVFYHLFGFNYAEQCVNLFHIGDMPLVTWLARACNPVVLFLLLSGYGLACKYEKGTLNPHHQADRAIFLYAHYWIILAVFVTLGHFMVPSLYPGSLSKVIENATGWHTTYNREMWFLLSYVLVSIASLYIIRSIDKIGYIWAIGITSLLYIVIYFINNHYSAQLYDNLALYQLLIIVQFLYPFTVGVAMRRTSINLNRHLPQWAVLAGILLLVFILCVTNLHLCYMFCAPLMVILFSHIRYPRLLKAMFIELGKKSMPMWMIHTWLAYYLFESQVYSLRHPLLIFIALTIASFLLSIPVMWLAGRLRQVAS